MTGLSFWRCAVLAGVLIGCAAGSSAAAEARQVVLLYDERPDLPGLAVLDKSLVESLTSGPAGAVEVYREAMDLSRFGSEAYLAMLRDSLRAKYAAKKIDVVVAAMGPALDFLLSHGDQVFPGTPIVFCGIDRREIERHALPSHVTGVLLKREFSPTLQAALRLRPDATRVVFVGGTSEFDARLVEQARGEFRAYENRLAFTYLTALPLRELLAQLAKLPSQTIVLYSTMFRDGAGEAFVPHEVAERISAASSVPVYGFLDQYLGRGIVGGQLYSLGAHGREAADLARRILAGKKPSELPLREGAAGAYLFDWRQMTRWGIREDRLPPGSTVLFREPGAWDQYQPYIVATSLLVLLQTALLASLLVQRARRRGIERALRESQQRYTLATGAGSIGVWDWNFATNQLYVDPGLKSLLGFDDGEISNCPEDWGSRLHPEDVQAATTRVKACIDGETDAYEIEHRMVHKDGSVKWFLSRGSAMRGASGALLRLVGTKVDITAIKTAEQVIGESQVALEVSHREIQHLAGRLIESQDAERARIARDLHDDVSQQLAGLSIAVTGLKHRAAGLPGSEDLQADLRALQQRTGTLAENVRHLSHDLHPSVLQHVGLVAALTGHCAELGRQHSLVLTCRAEGEFQSLAPDSALCLYRIGQEALRNVVAHAGARRADVRLLRTADCVEIVIADDGRGFEVARSESRKGLGLVSITERVRLAGGTVSIMSELQKGTRLCARIPAANGLAHAEAGDRSAGRVA